eukprot:3633175-Rhodomonas_salina.1
MRSLVLDFVVWYSDFVLTPPPRARPKLEQPSASSHVLLCFNFRSLAHSAAVCRGYTRLEAER